MAKIPRNSGFDGRMFLTEAEWRTFCRRMPVRYIRKKKEAACQVCGNPESLDNPFQNAHVISFNIGVIDLALTPDFLDSDDNIATAHRIACNKATELDLRASMAHLMSLKVQGLPAFLPDFIHELWHEVAAQSNDPNESCARSGLRIDDPNSAHDGESGSSTE
jgi:hypothetical protein